MLSDVRHFTLPNGLKVLLKEDRRVPVACVLTWVNVGYFDEPDAHLGISHFIEHLFFKGTQSRGVGEIANEIKSLGGYLNAATIYDCTYYYTVVPSKHVDKALEIQSDALLHPLFDAAEMEREKEIIVQELKRKYDNPSPYAWEKLLELAFDQHRIRRWRMGKEEHIRGYERSAVIDYYQNFYRAKNTVLVVVGDIDPEKIAKQIERLYLPMAEGDVVRAPSIAEPPQRKAKISRLAGDISQAWIKIGFQTPSRQDPDYFPLTVLATLLGKGKSSRFYRSLKEEKGIADGIGASLYASADVGFFTVDAEMKPEKLSACEEEIFVELDRLRRDPPTPAEVEKVRSIVEANFFAEKEDVMGQAYSLAYFESIGSYNKAFEYVEKMRNVTPADLVRVSEKYFAFEHMSLLEYVPSSVGAGASMDARLDSLEKRIVARIEQAGPRVAPQEAQAVSPLIFTPGKSAPIFRGIEPYALPSGATLLHLQTQALPLVSLGIYFPGGRSDETRENCGISQFVLQNTLKGAERRTSDEISFEMESLGSSISVESTADIFGYATRLLSRNLEKGLDLVADVIMRPTFPMDELEKERVFTFAQLRHLRDDMFRFPIELFYRALYGVHPYGLPRFGTMESVETFTRPQITDWFNQTFQWKKMVIAMVGDVERSRAVELAQRHFDVAGDTEPTHRAQILPAIPPHGIRESIEVRDRKQTGLVLGFSGVSVRDNRFFALEVLRNVLSGMGGRLYMSLREKKPLAYNVAAFNLGLLRGGAFFCYMAISPEKEEEATKGLLQELGKLRDRAPSDLEIKAAKTYAKGSFLIGLQSNGRVAYEYLQHYLAGRGMTALEEYEERIDSVSAGELLSVAREIIDLEQFAVGVVRGKTS